MGHGSDETPYTSPLAAGTMPVIYLHVRNPKKRSIDNSCTRRDRTPGMGRPTALAHLTPTVYRWAAYSQERVLMLCRKHVHPQGIHIYTYGYDYGTFDNSLWSRLRCELTFSLSWHIAIASVITCGSLVTMPLSTRLSSTTAMRYNEGICITAQSAIALVFFNGGL